MSDLFGNHIVVFSMRRLNYVCYKIFPAEARTKRSAITVGECCVSRKHVMCTPYTPFYIVKLGFTALQGYTCICFP